MSSPSTIDVAKVDADPELDALFVGVLRVALGHPALHRDSAAQRVNNARELDQDAVAGGLDDASPVLGDVGSINSRRSAPSAASVPSSSSPISREYPATSAARIAASGVRCALRSRFLPGR